MSDKYAVTTEGDGGQTVIVSEADLPKQIHDAMCTCQNYQQCETEGIPQTLKSLDDDGEWSHPYPSFERHVWQQEFEEGGIHVARITERESNA